MFLWLVFTQIVFDISGLYYSVQVVFSHKDPEVDEAFLLIPFLVLFFYGTDAWLVPRFLRKGKWLKYLLGALAAYVGHAVVVYAVFLGMWNLGFQFMLDERDFLDGLLMISLLVLLASICWSITKVAFENSQRAQLAKQRQQEAEFKFLSMQFNPHFLFNTLNGIYALSTSEGAEQTTEAVLKLSEMMRYPINMGTEKSVALEKEIAFIEDYIHLQKLRLGEEYPIQLEKNGAFEGVEVLPLVFMPLVENAFKYGVSPRKKYPISMVLSVNEAGIYFMVENEVVQVQNIPSYKIGVENLKSRLEIVRPGRYTLSSHQSDQKFVAMLKLDME